LIGQYSICFGSDLASYLLKNQRFGGNNHPNQIVIFRWHEILLGVWPLTWPQSVSGDVVVS